jgi:hypothetical protein
VDTFFRGASFCKYVCPIGQFNFIGSLVSPLEVRVRQPQACAACATHDCLRGNQRQRGCELNLFLPRKAGNMDCTFCLDCVKACPHDNIGILAIAPGSGLLSDQRHGPHRHGPARSSVGRFSRRLDIAALALVVVFSAFATAAAMVGPANGFFFPAALVLAPALLMGAAAAKSIRELFCRLSLALTPLGLAMWAAHALFHGSTAWGAAWPVVQRAAGDLGFGWLGVPRWAVSRPLIAPDTLLAVQILLLDAGVLLSLYLGWRIARTCTSRSPYGLRLTALWAVIAVGLYVTGVWVFQQPMQMRGMVHG